MDVSDQFHTLFTTAVNQVDLRIPLCEVQSAYTRVTEETKPSIESNDEALTQRKLALVEMYDKSQRRIRFAASLPLCVLNVIVDLNKIITSESWSKMNTCMNNIRVSRGKNFVTMRQILLAGIVALRNYATTSRADFYCILCVLAERKKKSLPSFDIVDKMNSQQYTHFLTIFFSELFSTS